MIIKRCDEKDLETIFEIEEKSFKDPLSKDVLLKDLQRESCFCYALYEEECIGFLSYDRVLEEAQIISVAIHPNFQGKGYGRVLFEKVLEEAVKEGIELVTLELRSNNIPAMALYKRMGFKEVGRRKGYYKNPLCDAVLMDLELGKD